MTIVCGIDYSREARDAARCAAALAVRLQLRLILVHSIPPSTPSALHTWPYPASLDADPVVAAREAARDLAASTREAIGAPDAAIRIEMGRAPERLTAVADEHDAAMIVLGTHGEGRGRTVLLGSVSLATIRRARRPVVVVPPRVTELAAGHCLVCGVGDPDDARPARVAAELAHALDLPLQLAHVAPPQDEDVPGDTVSAVPLAVPRQPDDRPVIEGHQALGAAADAVAGVAELDRLRLLAGDPADQLDALARREGAALVVVGTRGRGAVRSALLGSVSRRLACRSGAPVVVCSDGA